MSSIGGRFGDNRRKVLYQNVIAFSAKNAGKRLKIQTKRKWIEIQDKRMYCLHIKFLRISMTYSHFNLAHLFLLKRLDVLWLMYLLFTSFALPFCNLQRVYI